MVFWIQIQIGSNYSMSKICISLMLGLRDIAVQCLQLNETRHSVTCARHLKKEEEGGRGLESYWFHLIEDTAGQCREIPASSIIIIIITFISQ